MNGTEEKNELSRLLAQVGHLHFKRAHMLLEKIGLYSGQPPLLYFLWRKEGRTQKELSKKLNVEPATLSKMIHRMEKAGLIVRRTDPEDMRISRIYLTDYGRNIKKKVDEIQKILEEECFEGFNGEEKILMKRFLIQIKKNILKSLKKR